jgi:hypothetical protein
MRLLSDSRSASILAGLVASLQLVDTTVERSALVGDAGLLVLPTLSFGVEADHVVEERGPLVPGSSSRKPIGGRRVPRNELGFGSALPWGIRHTT